MAGENYTLIGPRGFWPGPDTYEDMREAGMKWYTAMDVAEYDLREIIADAVKHATDGTDAVWISFDVMSPIRSRHRRARAGGLAPREAIARVRESVTQLDSENFGFDVLEVATPSTT